VYLGFTKDKNRAVVNLPGDSNSLLSVTETKFTLFFHLQSISTSLVVGIIYLLN